MPKIITPAMRAHLGAETTRVAAIWRITRKDFHAELRGLSPTSFAAGDRLGIVNEDPADATLAGVSLTFAGTRGS